MNPQLSSYEMLGGYHPKVIQFTDQEARIRIEQALQKAKGSRSWWDLAQALRVVGIEPPLEEARLSIEERLSQVLKDPIKTQALAEYLERGLSNLEWRDGFLAQAAEQGQ